jgi:hypothetical protein
MRADLPAVKRLAYPALWASGVNTACLSWKVPKTLFVFQVEFADGKWQMKNGKWKMLYALLEESHPLNKQRESHAPTYTQR